MNVRWGMILSVLLLALVLAPLQAQGVAAQDEAADLRIGVLPVLNILPLYVAQDSGLFAEAGLTVELVEFPSSKDMQAAARAGELDGFQSDLVSALKVNANGGDFRVARHVGITSFPFFSIMVGRDSEIQSLAELAGQKIAISKNTIVQYIADELLAGAGLSAGEVEYFAAPGIQERMQRVIDGEVAAAVLPEPIVQLTRLNGNRVIATDAVLDYVPEALSLSAAVLSEKGDTARAFLAAYEQAVVALNAMDGDQAAYRDSLVEGGSLSQGQSQFVSFAIEQDFLTVPRFARARVMSAEQYAVVHDWALAAGVISAAQAYDAVVDGSLLPEVSADELADEGEMVAVMDEARTPDATGTGEPHLRIVVINSYLITLPLVVARGAGYFAEEGVVVDFAEVVSLERLRYGVLEGEYDGYIINGVYDIFFPLFNTGGGDARIVRSIEMSSAPAQIIVSSPLSGAATIADLAGKRIAVVENSAAEYVIDSYLAIAGLSGEDVEYVYLPGSETGMMFDMLMQGQLDATITDVSMEAFVPLYGGAVPSQSVTPPDIGVGGVLGFRADVLAENGAAVRAFLRAFERAVATLNAMAGDTAAYKAFSIEKGMAEQSGIAVGVFNGFSPVPAFAPAAVPSAEDIAPLMEWALAHGLLDEAIAYEQLVDPSFLPDSAEE